ncbi:hypothetical protein SLAVM298S_01849 [Streptomyces lavendulae subsp. lavendulae]
MPEYCGNLSADQPEQLPLQLGRTEPGQPVDRRPGHLGPVGGSGGPGLQKLGEEGAGPYEAEGRAEPLPVHVRDEQSRTVRRAHALAQDGHRGVGRHGRQPLTPHPRLQGVISGHTTLGPRTPRERGRGQPGGPPLLRESIQVGVRSSVITLTGRTGHPAHRGEQHERGQLDPELDSQLVQVQRRRGLRPQHALEPLRSQRLQHTVIQHTRGMHHSRQRLGLSSKQLPQRLPVSSVTRHHRHLDARLRELRRQLGRTRRIHTPATGQHQALGTHTSQPPRNPTTQRTRTTSHQHSPGRHPRTSTTGSRTNQPTPEHPRSPDRDLILTGKTTRQHTSQPAHHPLVPHLRKIHQATPALRNLQSGNPAQTPHLRLNRRDETVRTAHTHRAPGQAPQRCPHPGVAHRLKQPSRGGHPGGLVQRQQRHHTSHGAGPGQKPAQSTPIGARRDLNPVHLGTACRQRTRHGRVVHVPGRRHEQPGAQQPGTGSGVRQRLPRHPVAPCVHLGAGPQTTAPRRQGGQGRQDGVPGVLVVQVQGGGEGLHVLTLHRVPETGIHVVPGTPAGCRSRRHLQPVALALEGVRRQLDAPGTRTGEVGGPVHLRAPHVGLGQCGDGRLRLGPPAAQNGYEAGGLAAHAFLAQGGEHARRADFEVRRDAGRFEGLHAVEEADGFADVPDPELGRTHLVRDERPGQVGDERDARGSQGQPLHHLAEVVQHAVHVRRVERVADGEALGLAVGEGLHDRDGGVLVTGDDHRGRPVDGGDAHPVGQQRQDLVLRSLHRDHHTTRRQRLHQPAARRHQRTRVVQRQHTRHVRGGDLTDGVTGQVVGLQAPGLDQPEQCHLDREQRGLGVARLVQETCVRAEQHVLHRQFEPRAHLVQGGREHREGVIQLAAHAQALAALTGEEEGELAGDR